MTPEQIQALQAPNAVKNTSIAEVKSFLFPQLLPLGLSPSGPYCDPTGIMHGQGSGPGGFYTVEELHNMGLPDDVPVYLQYQLGGHQDFYDAADAVRILQGYRGDSSIAPDPTYWYVDRVKTLYRESFNSDDVNAMNSMLYMPAVRQAVEDTMLEAVPAHAIEPKPSTPVSHPAEPRAAAGAAETGTAPAGDPPANG